MELDDLKIAWTELDRRIANVEYVVRADRQARTFSSVRRVLRLLGMRQAVQVVAGIFMIAIVAPYWIAHHGVPHLLIAGLSLHLYGVLAVCAAVVQLLVIGRTYYTAPVVTFQKRMAELQRLRIVCALATGLPWFVLWIPLMVVGVDRWLGVDLYLRMPAWMLGNVGLGFVVMAVSVWIARRMAGRPRESRPKWVQRVIDDLAGCSLRRVARELEEIENFEAA